MTDRLTTGRRVHLARTGDGALDAALLGFEMIAAQSTVGHVLVDEPEAADLVLLTQAHLCPDPLSLAALRHSEAWTDHQEKTFVIDFRDRPWCAFPGLYTSMPVRHFRQRWQGAWLYPWIDEARFLPLRHSEPDLLFSFLGGHTHPCREAIFAMDSRLGVVEDSRGFDYLDASSSAAEGRRHFTELVARSMFVLCPRGHGTSSFRLQEVLAAGRIPVIISDDWVPPNGPDWSGAIIRWPEGHVDGLTQELVRMAERYERMSTAAAALYDEWFASDPMFDRMIEQLVGLGDTSGFPAVGVRDRWYARLALADLNAKLSGRLHRSRRR